MWTEGGTDKEVKSPDMMWTDEQTDGRADSVIHIYYRHFVCGSIIIKNKQTDERMDNFGQTDKSFGGNSK